MFLKSVIIFLVMYLANAEYCKHVLHQLASTQMLFVSCITSSSVPVTMCMECVGKHEDMLMAYDKLKANCSSIYFNKDRINLVASTESVLTGLWSKAYCDDCFNNNHSVTFSDKNTTLENCFAKEHDDPCGKCKEQYMDLNNFFNSLDQHNNGEVCYDLQDKMNRTRNKWSKELKCCRRERDMMLFIIALVITCCLPLLFYGSTFYVTKRREQSRHRVLYNEDLPTHNSELPSSSRGYNITDISNPTQSLLNNLSSTSNTNTTNAIATPSLKVAYKNDSNEDTDSSDDDMQIKVGIESKEKFKII